jgi:hypothetical protein
MIKKSLLILITLFVSLNLLSQKTLKDSISIKTDMFQIVYSETLQQPKWIKYTVQCPSGSASRSGMDFYICDSITTTDSTQLSQLRQVITLSDSIILQQKVIIHNDSIDKVCLTKWGKKQRRQKNLALLGLGVLGGGLLVK